MTHLNENFVVDAKGNQVDVFLPIKDYNKLMEELEEPDDVKAYDNAMSRKLDFVPLEQALKQIETSLKKEKVMYQIVIEKQAQKELAKIPSPDYKIRSLLP